MATLDDFLSFLQGASNSAASAVSAPVDGINWALGKVGVPVSKKPVGGSEWLKELGFTAEPKNKTAGLLGEAVGGVLPIVAQAKAPQIAAGINQMISNAQAPRTLNPQTGAVVWHGSPHRFTKFDSSKIGTGEGRQQQGIGAYLAEAQAVGQKYADKEAWKRGMDSGYLYKVDIPDDMVAKMANHDMPFAMQPENVKKSVGALFGPNELKALKDYHGWELLDDAPFSAVMDAMEIARGNNRAATSQMLREAGIPGIRYLDGGSRGVGQGTSNFVVFPGNEGLLSILERNGQPLR